MEFPFRQLLIQKSNVKIEIRIQQNVELSTKSQLAEVEYQGKNWEVKTPLSFNNILNLYPGETKLQ